MAHAPEPSFEELLWTIAVTRLLFGPSMNIQAPPNLTSGRWLSAYSSSIIMTCVQPNNRSALYTAARSRLCFAQHVEPADRDIVRGTAMWSCFGKHDFICPLSLDCTAFEAERKHWKSQRQHIRPLCRERWGRCGLEGDFERRRK